LKQIGKGGYGEVWLAENTTLHKLRAIKFVRRDAFEGGRVFEREFNGVKSFDEVSRRHEGLVAILHVGEAPDGQCFYYVMELADDANATAGTGATEAESAQSPTGTGPPAERRIDVARYSPRTLHEEVRRRGRLPPRDVLQIGIQLAGALAKLHSERLVHRDVKPGNVVFIKGQPKLADPGLVVFDGEARSQPGTFGFMPSDCPGTPEADAYSLGKTLHIIATGMSVERFPDLPRDFNPEPDELIWKRLNEVISNASGPKSARRYRNGQELLEDLLRIQDGLRPKRHLNQRTVALAGAAGMGLTIVGLVAALIFNSPKERVLLDEDFDSAALDTNRWHVGTKIGPEPTPPSTEAFGKRPYLTNGALVIESAVSSSSAPKMGWAIRQDAWVETVGDLWDAGETRIEMDCEASVAAGSIQLAIVAGPPTNRVGVNLFVRSGGLLQGLNIRRNTLTVEVSPASGRAVVYWLDQPDERDIVDLSDLPPRVAWFAQISPTWRIGPLREKSF